MTELDVFICVLAITLLLFFLIAHDLVIKCDLNLNLIQLLLGESLLFSHFFDSGVSFITVNVGYLSILLLVRPFELFLSRVSASVVLVDCE